MPFQKGHKSAGGRPKGSKNKNSIKSQEIAESMGVDPLEVLLMFVAGDWKGLGYDSPTHEMILNGGIVVEVERIPLSMRQKAAKDVMPYIKPALKSVDMQIEADVNNKHEFKKGDYERYIESLIEEDK